MNIYKKQNPLRQQGVMYGKNWSFDQRFDFALLIIPFQPGFLNHSGYFYTDNNLFRGFNHGKNI